MEVVEKYFLVTGSTSGIGRDLTNTLLELGSHVIGFDKQVSSINHSNYVHVVVDVSDEDAVASAMKSLTTLHGVINVAGITGANQCLEQTAPKQFRRLIETHLFGTYHVCHYALPLLKQQESGVIINFSSLFALRAMPHYIGYNAAKTAIISLTETMALELAPRIRVNAVAPGFIDTPMTQSNPNYDKLVSMVEKTYPLKKGGQTSHVVDTVLFLMRNDFMTGETIAITGGAHL